MTTATRQRPAPALRLRVQRPAPGMPLGVSDEDAVRFVVALQRLAVGSERPHVVLDADAAVPPGQLEAVRRVVGELLEEGES